MNDQKSNVICVEDLAELSRVGYSPAELAEMELIFAPLSTTARLYLARLFIRAKIGNKPFDQVMQAVRQMWKDVWRHGTPDRLADPDDVAPPNVGMRNTCAFYEVYKIIGLPSPKLLSV
jgi:hypothetical protein